MASNLTDVNGGKHMEERARVVFTDGNIAKVVLKRSSACGDNCAQCKGCSPGMTYVEAKNLIGAKVGQEVILEMKSGMFLGAVLITYVLPLIALTVGIILGTNISIPIGLNISNEMLGVILGFVLMAVTYLFINLIDRKYKKSGKISFTIAKIAK